MQRCSSAILFVVCALLSACAAAPAQPTAAPVPGAISPTSSAAALATTDVPAATQAPLATSAPTVAATAVPATPTVSVPTLERILLFENPATIGEDVRAAQQRLLDLGYNQVGEADGVFGQKTDTAIRIFQALNDLTRDGVIGPDTWETLFSGTATRYDLHPIVDTQSSLLIGATNAGEWMNVETIGDVVGERGYRLLGQRGTRDGIVAGSAPRLPDAPCDYARVVTFEGVGIGTQSNEGGSTVDPSLPIGLDSEWNVLPRAVAELPVDTATLQAPVAETLRTLGLAEPQVTVTRALRADLDNDGTEETIVAATYRASGQAFPAPSAAIGDYSLLLTIPSDTNRATVIAADVITETIEFGAPLQFTLTGIWDLNGDGRMEIVAHSTYFEGDTISIYSLDGITTKVELLTGCGV